MNSDTLILKINQLELWLESSKGSVSQFPLRIGGYFLLVFFMMSSNFWALIRWPFSAAGRIFSSGPSKKPNDQPVDANRETLESVLRSESVVLVDFWAEWCGPCVMMNNSVQKLAARETGHCVVAKVNTVSNPDLAKTYGVKGLPTLLLFKNGDEVKRHAGALSFGELKEFIRD